MKQYFGGPAQHMTMHALLINNLLTTCRIAQHRNTVFEVH
jgi:hypothetical protein